VRRRETVSVLPLLLQNANPATFRFLTSCIGTSDIFRVRFTVSPNSGRAAALTFAFLVQSRLTVYTQWLKRAHSHLYVTRLRSIYAAAHLLRMF